MSVRSLVNTKLKKVDLAFASIVFTISFTALTLALFLRLKELVYPLIISVGILLATRSIIYRKLSKI